MKAGAKYFLYAIAALNLATLLVLFIFPRFQFMRAHSGWTFSQLQETPGPRDMPNQFHLTYRVANRVRELTPESATVFLPPGDRPGSFRSAAVQVLFPRRVYSGATDEFDEHLRQARAQAYFVFAPDWHPQSCPDHKRVMLNDSGFGLCGLD